MIVRLRGGITQEHISSICGELKAILQASEDPLDVLLDFTSAEQCAVNTRHGFLELQQMLMESGGRTAYVANRPRLRGIALWVVHQADDPRAKAMAKVSQAERWFAQRDERGAEVDSNATRLADRLSGLGGAAR